MTRLLLPAPSSDQRSIVEERIATSRCSSPISPSDGADDRPDRAPGERGQLVQRRRVDRGACDDFSQEERARLARPGRRLRVLDGREVAWRQARATVTMAPSISPTQKSSPPSPMATGMRTMASPSARRGEGAHRELVVAAVDVDFFVAGACTSAIAIEGRRPVDVGDAVAAGGVATICESARCSRGRGWRRVIGSSRARPALSTTRSPSKMHGIGRSAGAAASSRRRSGAVADAPVEALDERADVADQAVEDQVVVPWLALTASCASVDGGGVVLGVFAPSTTSTQGGIDRAQEQDAALLELRVDDQLVG
ncbi:MAG: hypothetical protein U1F43_33780 [Myxococcota bacterium]